MSLLKELSKNILNPFYKHFAPNGAKRNSTITLFSRKQSG